MGSDLSDLQELYDYLRTRPIDQVAEVISRIRSNTDPCKVIRLMRDGDLLLQVSAMANKALEADVEGAVKRIDAMTYQQNPLKLTAKPWTDVGGDGLVSELVSIFFDIEQPFATTYVDKHRFLEEMRAGDIKNAKFCSPALVSVICAIGAVSGLIICQAISLHISC